MTSRLSQLSETTASHLASRPPLNLRQTEDPNLHINLEVSIGSHWEIPLTIANTLFRKLGYGQYSTICLARKTKQVTSASWNILFTYYLSAIFWTQKHIALGIPRADCYDGSRGIFEKEMLSKVLCTIADFRIYKSQGQSICFTSPEQSGMTGNKWGSCLSGIYCFGAPFELSRCEVCRWEITAHQFLMELDVLHRPCGIIHIGMIVSLRSASFSQNGWLF